MIHLILKLAGDRESPNCYRTKHGYAFNLFLNLNRILVRYLDKDGYIMQQLVPTNSYT